MEASSIPTFGAIMTRLPVRIANHRRRATASVELAVVLPFICFMFAVAADYARIFYFGVTLENCARNGAYYSSNYPNANYVYNDIYGYRNVDEAILKDATNLYSVADPSTKPTYTIEYGDASEGPFGSTQTSTSKYVRVSVRWTFHSITNFPLIPANVELSRAVIMRLSPTMPTFP